MKVYISGRVTGLPYEEAWMNFQMVEDLLIEDGYDVVNPLRNGLDPDDPWEAHMKEDIRLLMGCDAIYMMDNWRSSAGANIEIGMAIMFGIRIMNESGKRIEITISDE